jgi:transcriptional regulator with XRE-family HTH domain
MSTHVTIRHFGDRLHMARRLNKLPQHRLAEAAGVSRATISNWEANTSLPNLEEAAALADLLGVDLDWLATGREREMEDGADRGLPTSRYVDDPPDQRVLPIAA